MDRSEIKQVNRETATTEYNTHNMENQNQQSSGTGTTPIFPTNVGGAIYEKAKEETFLDRLLNEARELAEKTNKLNDFMRTQAFINLDRQNKDLLYKQSRLMNEYLQVLGQRIEILGSKFSF